MRDPIVPEENKAPMVYQDQQHEPPQTLDTVPIVQPQLVQQPSAPESTCRYIVKCILVFGLATITIVALMITAAFVISSQPQTVCNKTVSRTLLGPTFVGEEKTPYVVSYHPFASGPYDLFHNKAPVVAGYGHFIDEDKTIYTHDSKPFIADENTTVAPYMQSLLLARQINPTTVQINTIGKGSNQASRDQFLTIHNEDMTIVRLGSLTQVKQELSRWYYVLVFTCSDGYVYAVHFEVQGNKDIEFDKPMKVGRGVSGTLVSLPNSLVTVAISVSDKTETTLYLCNIDSNSFLCTNVRSSKSPFINVYGGESDQELTYMYYGDDYATSQTISFKNKVPGKFLRNIPEADSSTKYPKVAVAGVDVGTQVVYEVRGRKLLARVLRRYELPHASWYRGSEDTVVAHDLSENPIVQVVIAASQIFFGYKNTNNQFALKVVGVVGDDSAWLSLCVSQWFGKLCQ